MNTLVWLINGDDNDDDDDDDDDDGGGGGAADDDDDDNNDDDDDDDDGADDDDDDGDDHVKTFYFELPVTDLLDTSLRFFDFHFIVINGSIQFAEFRLKRFQFFFSLLPHLLHKQKYAILFIR